MRLLAVLACVVLSGCVLSGSTKKQCQDGVVAGTSCAIDEDAHDDMTGATGVTDMTGATGVTETTGTTGETGETGSTGSTGTETPPAPTITRIAPSLQGADGSLVVIGTHLLAATVVTVGGGPAATIVSHTDTCMTIIVPVGSASGSVSVTAPGGTAMTSGFVLGAPAATDGCAAIACDSDADGDGIFDALEGRCTASPSDRDIDATPDYADTDSDNDYVLDSVEWRDGADTDADGQRDLLDTDSDGDAVADACEARANPTPTVADLPLPILDTDSDGKPDLIDRDSDGDMLTDSLEDKNGNCVLNSGESNRRVADTDGDGAGDLAEAVLLAATAANDALVTPANQGKQYIVVPYSADGSRPPLPSSTMVGLATDIRTVELGFIVDTTSSMASTLTALKTGIAGIRTTLDATVATLGIGVAGHDDMPTGAYGATGDLPYYGAPSGPFITTSATTAQNAMNSLVIHGGGDAADSQLAAMHYAFEGTAMSWSGGSIPFTPPTGTRTGGLGFDSRALSVLLHFTDAPAHDGKRALDTTGTSYDAALQNTYSGVAAGNADTLVAALNQRSAKVLSFVADNGTRGLAAGDAYGYAAFLADQTLSLAPPAAFSPPGACRTGINGATVAADGPTISGAQACRLVFSHPPDGSGLSAAVTSAVETLLRSVRFDVHGRATNAPGPFSPVTAFVAQLLPQPQGGVDPITAQVCVTFPQAGRADHFVGTSAMTGTDGALETITQMNPKAIHCFSLVAKPNTTRLPTASPQAFNVQLSANAETPNGDIPLGIIRDVTFIVPPNTD